MKKVKLFLSLMVMGLGVNASSFIDEYVMTVNFSANYNIGDYLELVKASPINAGGSGYYEISISHTRSNVAVASTHLANICHDNPSIWREVGKINGNGHGHNGFNFTVDCITEYVNHRFRIRAIALLGIGSEPIWVYIKIRSININGNWTAPSNTGNDLNVNKVVPLTNNWSL